MLLPKSKDCPIEDRHNQDKGEVGNIWEEARWSPDRSLKLNPMEFDKRCVEVGQVVSERKYNCEALWICLIFFSSFSVPEKFFSAQATKKGDICPGGGDKNAGGN